MRKLITFVTLSLVCSAAAAQHIYQWTDERGTVQFGQLPPANTPYQPLNIRAPAPISGQLRAPATVPSEPIREDVSSAARQAEQQQAQALKEYCEQLRKDLITMQDNPRLRRTNAEGEVERIGEDERQRLIQLAQGNLQEHCQN